jgi:thymidylate synthase ThyX
MRIMGLGITPPAAAKDNPAVTPELLASCLARYSRSNKGIDAILASIDPDDPDRSVERIFKFVDYGHASIGGMTGGIAMVVDGCSMFLAYKLFELSPYADGQESSTRYIKLDEGGLPEPDEIGIPEDAAREWREFCALAFELYRETYAKLDKTANEDPAVVRVPAGAPPRTAERLRRNYALDRARYFIPFAARTNAALVMTARAWADTIRQLDSVPLPETRACAAGLRRELEKFVPRLIRHSFPDEAGAFQARQTAGEAAGAIRGRGVPLSRLADEVHVGVFDNMPPFLPRRQSAEDAFRGRTSRYGAVGSGVRRVMVRAAWNNVAVAELRDLNRHRTGCRFTTLAPAGFYLPPEAGHERQQELLEKKRAVVARLAAHEGGAAFVYGLLLGTQVAFEHSMHLDKFIYEIELRTGMGAHFRYAEHLAAAAGELVRLMPDLAPFVRVGTAEPE